MHCSQMRKVMLTTIFLTIFIAFSSAQRGSIIYETTIYPQAKLPPEASAWAAQIPEKIANNHMLLFDGQVSIYKIIPQQPTADSDLNDRSGRMMRMFRSNSTESIYFDWEKGTKITQRTFFGKQFLISDTIKHNEWRILAAEQRQIGPYLCIKAMLMDTIDTEVWFTPQVPISLGPEDYTGLPGLIMAVNIPDKKVVIAKEIFLDELKEEIITPVQGEKVTRKKFDQIVEEKMEEMRSMRRSRSGGSFYFRMN